MGADLQDALDFRRVVEGGAAGLAATRTFTAADRAYLRLRLDQATASTEDPDRRLADSRLHLAIAGLSASPTLAQAVADVQLRLDHLLAAIPVLRRNIAHSDAQHAAVVDAVLAGNPDGAREAMEEHVDATSALLRASSHRHQPRTFSQHTLVEAHMTGGTPLLSLEQLKRDVESGVTDTVLVCFADMQGRLQGKRIHAPFFLDRCCAHGTRVQLPARRRRRHEHRGRLRVTRGTRLRRLRHDADLSTLRRVPWHAGTVCCCADLGGGGSRCAAPGRS
jgi:hypothetical protein